MENTPKLPGFLIIGAQKCGTSWLHHQLSRQAGIYMSQPKELEFFSYEPHLKDPGIAWYQDQFAQAGDRLCGEASASYFWTWNDSPWCNMPPGFQHHIPEVVRAELGPSLRLVLCLRNPVDRAISAWAHYLAHGELDPALPFREACNYGGIVDMGFYARHLQRWLQAYPGQQILVVHMEEDIAARPHRTLQRVMKFLDVEFISSEDEDMRQKVFPGPARKLIESPTAGGDVIGIDIQIESLDRKVHVSADDLMWLTVLYRADQEALANLLPKTAAPAD